MDQEIVQAIVPHIPTIIGCVVALVVSVLTCTIVMVNAHKEKIKKDFEREYGEPLKLTTDEITVAGLDGYKIIAPKGKKIVELTDCLFVKKKVDKHE